MVGSCKHDESITSTTKNSLSKEEKDEEGSVGGLMISEK